MKYNQPLYSHWHHRGSEVTAMACHGLPFQEKRVRCWLARAPLSCPALCISRWPIPAKQKPAYLSDTWDEALFPGLRQRAFQNERGVHTKNKGNTIRRPWDASRSSQEEQRNHLEPFSTAQPSSRVFRNQTGISTAAFKSKRNTGPPFPRAVRANRRLSLSIT